MRLVQRSPPLPRKRGLTPNPQLRWLKGLRGRICAGAAAALVAVSATSALGSERYDPRLRFRTISTPRFDIHFHQGEEAIAKRLAAVAEQVAIEMEPRLGRPRMRVNVILVDQTDLSNGWATPVPYNLIEIAAAGPRADSIIGNTRDWLRLVFTHEYTHVLHLERSRGWFGAIGRPFGRAAFFYPNLFLPPMLIEGIATHEEGAVTGEGRPPAGDFRMMIDQAGAAGRFPSLARASNYLVDWPSGHTPYLYGGYFHDYLAKTYGRESLERLANATAAWPPYFGSLAFRRVYRKPLGELWDDFARDYSTSATTASSRTRLTHHGFNVSAPWHSPDGRLFYLVANPHDFPTLMEFSADKPRLITTQVNGGRLGGTKEEIIYDQVEYVRSVALTSDLYAVNPVTRAVRRLTKYRRAADPHVSPDGKTIACIVQRPEGRALATLRMPLAGAVGVPETLSFDAGVDFAAPRWSPDGRRIAVERRVLGGPSEIVVVDATTGSIEHVARETPTARMSGPAWSPDGQTLLFAASLNGRPFEIHEMSVASGKIRRLTNAGDSAQSPDISPDGKTLVFVGYTHAGYDLFSMALAEAVWEPVTGETLDAASAPPMGPPVTSPPAVVTGNYNPLRTLAPRFWTPILELDNEQLWAGAATAGVDALGRHAYFGGAVWSTRARPNWYAGYTYDRWRPIFFASAADDTDPWDEDGTLRTKEVNAGGLIRFRTIRRSQLLFGSFHGASETIDCPSCTPAEESTIARRAIRAAWSIDTSRQYGYSISDEYGFNLTASTEWTRRALGASGNAGAAIVDGRGYVRLGPRHAALAVRAAGASAWGDRPVRRLFAPGGNGPQPGDIAFDLDAISLIRGFETNDVNGPRAVVVNLDYRFPLRWIERGVGTWPLFARSLHGAVFADAGAAWESQLTRRDRRASLGAELSADVVLAYSLPLTLAGGVAWRHDPTGRSHGATLFARVGRAF